MIARYLTLLFLFVIFLQVDILQAQSSPAEIDRINHSAFDLREIDSTAYTMAQHALSASEKINYPAGKAAAYSTMGFILCNRGDYDEGYKNYRISLAIRQGLGDSLKVANVYNALSNFKRTEGEYDVSIQYGLQALTLLENLFKTSDPADSSYTRLARGLGKNYLNLANTYDHLEKTAQALDMSRTGLEMMRRTRDPACIAEAEYNLAVRFMAGDSLYESDSAALYFTNVLKYWEDPNHSETGINLLDIGYTYINLGEIYTGKQEYTKAWQLLDKANDVFRELDESEDKKEGSFYLLCARARWWSLHNDHKRTLDLLQQAQNLNALFLVDQNKQKNFFTQLSEAYEANGKPDLALKYLKMVSTLKDSLYLDSNTGQEIENLKNKADKSRNELELERKSAQNRTLLLASTALALLALLLGMIWRQRENAAKRKAEVLQQSVQSKFLEGVIEGQEDQRRAIGKTLHDDIGSRLVSITWMAESSLNNIPLDSGQYMMANRIHEQLKTATERVRALSHQLDTGIIERFGLVQAIHELCTDASLNGMIRTTIDDSSWIEPPDSKMKVHILRIVQELVSNTLKHAKATQIDIRLESNAQHVILSYADNGIGMGALPVKGGIGTRNIDERVNALEAVIERQSSPGNGLRVIIRIPNRQEFTQRSSQ